MFSINYLTVARRLSTNSLKQKCILHLKTLTKAFKTSSKQSNRFLTLDNMNKNIVNMQYAVHGPVPMRAAEIKIDLENGAQKPFKELLMANIGDCQAMGQPYITFLRDVVTLVTDPSNFKESKYPEDAKLRAQTILDGCAGKSVGSYTDSVGIEVIRRHVADYITERDDGVPASHTNIFLSGGATPAIKSVLSWLNRETNGLHCGVLLPIPQYPLYSATLAEYGMYQVDYYLNEENNWSLDVCELELALDSVKGKCIPRALVVINPGNPTGQLLTENNIKEIIKFAHENRLFILADEVYQLNVYGENCKFHSFKKVMNEMGPPYSCMEMASFMSASKGLVGECGLRGGYCELVNVADDVNAMFLKSLSAQLCSATIGQAALDVVVNPPRAGEASFEKYQKEINAVHHGMEEKGRLIYETFNTFEGFTCNPVQGAWYAFPQIKLPAKAIAEAKNGGEPSDEFYALALLEATGICVVPGSGFGQRPNTYHFRTTILQPLDKIKIMLILFEKFHKSFIAKYK